MIGSPSRAVHENEHDWIVYAVINDESQYVYVGIALDPVARVAQHYVEASHKTRLGKSLSVFNRWMFAYVQRSGELPKYVVLSRVRGTRSVAEKTEALHIRGHADSGHPILNNHSSGIKHGWNVNGRLAAAGLKATPAPRRKASKP